MYTINIHKLVLDYNSKDFRGLIKKLTLSHLPDINNKKTGILVGSRGIHNIGQILSKLIHEISGKGGIPCIIPAMGSHGGGTPKGQLSLLEKIGISKKKLGVKIVSSDRYVTIGKIFKDRPVVINEIADKMDILVGINRIKPHSRFSGSYESGILKLLSAGLGASRGANNFHKTAEQYGFQETLLQTSGLLLKNMNFLCFVGIIEDRLSATLDIRVIEPSRIFEQEKKMLSIAKKNIPSVPFSDIDLLVINEMGKNISGGGIDPCVTGGKKGAERIARRIYVRSLSRESEGNAFGMGQADFISRKLYRSIDFEKTYRNAHSSMNFNSVKMPLWFGSDESAVKFAAESLGKSFVDDLKIVWIENTLDLEQIYITSNLLKSNLGSYKPVHKLKLSFNKRGNMTIES